MLVILSFFLSSLTPIYSMFFVLCPNREISETRCRYGVPLIFPILWPIAINLSLVISSLRLGHYLWRWLSRPMLVEEAEAIMVFRRNQLGGAILVFNSAGRVTRDASAEILVSACCQSWCDNFFFSAVMHKFLG